jgi:hypothetical protein
MGVVVRSVYPILGFKFQFFILLSSLFEQIPTFVTASGSYPPN